MFDYYYRTSRAKINRVYFTLLFFFIFGTWQRCSGVKIGKGGGGTYTQTARIAEMASRHFGKVPAKLRDPQLPLRRMFQPEFTEPKHDCAELPYSRES